LSEHRWDLEELAVGGDFAPDHLDRHAALAAPSLRGMPPPARSAGPRDMSTAVAMILANLEQLVRELARNTDATAVSDLLLIASNQPHATPSVPDIPVAGVRRIVLTDRRQGGTIQLPAGVATQVAYASNGRSGGLITDTSSGGQSLSASGQAAAPAAGAAIATLAAPGAGVYTVTVDAAFLAGVPTAAADALNWELKVGATVIGVLPPVPIVLGQQGAQAVFQNVAVPAGAAVTVNAIGAGTAGVTYAASISAAAQSTGVTLYLGTPSEVNAGAALPTVPLAACGEWDLLLSKALWGGDVTAVSTSGGSVAVALT
jgi:hypothetical protein